MVTLLSSGELRENLLVLTGKLHNVSLQLLDFFSFEVDLGLEFITLESDTVSFLDLGVELGVELGFRSGELQLELIDATLRSFNLALEFRALCDKTGVLDHFAFKL